MCTTCRIQHRHIRHPTKIEYKRGTCSEQLLYTIHTRTVRIGPGRVVFKIRDQDAYCTHVQSVPGQFAYGKSFDSLGFNLNVCLFVLCVCIQVYDGAVADLIVDALAGGESSPEGRTHQVKGVQLACGRRIQADSVVSVGTGNDRPFRRCFCYWLHRSQTHHG